MNIHKTEEGHYEIWCHVCEQPIEVGDIMRDGELVRCILCGTVLGYYWDLPDEVKDLITW